MLQYFKSCHMAHQFAFSFENLATRDWESSLYSEWPLVSQKHGLYFYGRRGESRQWATTAALLRLISGNAITGQIESKEGRNGGQEKELGLAQVEFQAFETIKLELYNGC